MVRSAVVSAFSLPRALALLTALAAACTGDTPEEEDRWHVVHNNLDAALFSVWGASATDVWAVGADARDGSGPLVLRFDGAAWSRLPTGEAQGDLWWVFGFPGGPVYLGGDGGVILRYQAGAFTRLATPGLQTIFGIWGATPDDLWAVGGASDSTGGFAWRLQGGGDTWLPEPSLPAEVATGAAVWKIYGARADDAWLVGSNGVALHWDGAALTPGETGVGSSLFTVHHQGGRYAAVGGHATGIILEREGDQWVNVTPAEPPAGLAGVTLGPGGLGLAVGTFGALLTRSDAGWQEAALGFNLGQNLHGSWIDETGGLWAVGGQTFSPPYNEGILLYRGPPLPTGGL
jgi:hypothetical protein